MRVLFAILLLTGTTYSLAADQKGVFCLESFQSSGPSYLAPGCKKMCEKEYTVPRCPQIDSGWQIVQAMQKSIPIGDPVLQCQCQGTFYLLTKGNQEDTISKKEADLLHREIEVLKSENDMLKREIEQLKSDNARSASRSNKKKIN